MLKAYDPQHGYMFQIFTKYKGQREYEHCDYAINRQEKNYLINEYRLAYGVDYSFKTVMLPRKYWADWSDRNECRKNG